MSVLIDSFLQQRICSGVTGVRSFVTFNEGSAKFPVHHSYRMGRKLCVYIVFFLVKWKNLRSKLLVERAAELLLE